MIKRKATARRILPEQRRLCFLEITALDAAPIKDCQQGFMLLVRRAHSGRIAEANRMRSGPLAPRSRTLDWGTSTTRAKGQSRATALGSTIGRFSSAVVLRNAFNSISTALAAD